MIATIVFYTVAAIIILGMSFLVVFNLVMWRKFIIVRDFIRAETERKDAHTQLFEDLTDQDKILNEMEASAVASEALRAKRTMKIRDDAGPHAIIHKPPTRSAPSRRQYFPNPPTIGDVEFERPKDIGLDDSKKDD
jgi:hypothetical protein